jgi:hypothetical protein
LTPTVQRIANPDTEAAMSRFLIWIFVPVLFASKIAAAQTPGTLVEGQRVRVAFRCKLAGDQVIECRERRSPRIVTGHLQAVAGDTLRIRAQSSGAELAIPTASVAQVWEVEGSKGNFWAGAGIGLFAGALIGGVIGSTQELCILNCVPATGFGGIIGAPAGFLLGGVVGAVIRSDRWRAVPGNDHRVSVAPRLDAIGLNVSVAF